MNATPPPTPPQMSTFGEGSSDELIFNKWETGEFVLSIWTRGDGVVEHVEIRLRARSPFQGRCRCGGVKRQNLERAVAADAEMVQELEVRN